MQFKRKYQVIGISHKPTFFVIELQSDQPYEQATLVFYGDSSWSVLPADVKDGSLLTAVFTSGPEIPDGLNFRADIHKTDDYYVGYYGQPNRAEVQTVLTLIHVTDDDDDQRYAGRIKLIIGKRRAFRVFKKMIAPGIVFTLIFE